VISNVNLLSRFLYAFKNIHLGSRRRFQIHAGFIFEDMVKRDLPAIGFQVTDVKRINRKEFDVVTVHRDVIYNFQCKNNWIDLAKVESDRALFVRYNRSLSNYYQRRIRGSRNETSLLSGRKLCEAALQFEVARRALKTNVSGLAIDLSSPPERRCEQTNCVDGVAFATVVFTHEDRQVALEFDLSLVERAKAVELYILEIH
jgi:hypothetical protein